MNHGARSHAKYSASNAHRILRCPGQVAMAEASPPIPDSEEQIEGTLAHERLERAIRGDAGWRRDCGDRTDMVAAIDLVLDWLEGLYANRGPSLVIHAEQPFVFPQSVVPASFAEGICDIMVVDHDAKEAWVVDFKFGFTSVEPERNPQLLFYAVGRLWREPIAKVHCVVIQPRIEHHPRGVIRAWTTDVFGLIEAQREMEAAIALAETSTALHAGPHCRWCPAEPTCPERQRHALAPLGAADVQSVSLAPPELLGMDRIATILAHADTLRTWLKAIESFAHKMQMQGIEVPGFKLVEAQGRRQWQGDPEYVASEIIRISGDRLSLDDVMPRELINLTDAEAKLVEIAKMYAATGEKAKAGKLVKDALAFLTLRQSSGNLMLVPESDARPAANRVAAAFGNVKLIPPPGV